jgi:hypothetical protein
MIVEFLPEAKSELLDAVAYYEGELNGLGQRLWDEVDEHIGLVQITKYPSPHRRLSACELKSISLLHFLRCS